MKTKVHIEERVDDYVITHERTFDGLMAKMDVHGYCVSISGEFPFRVLRQRAAPVMDVLTGTLHVYFGLPDDPSQPPPDFVGWKTTRKRR